MEPTPGEPLLDEPTCLISPEMSRLSPWLLGGQSGCWGMGGGEGAGRGSCHLMQTLNL